VLFHNYLKLLLSDFKKSLWKVGICFAILVFGAITIGKTYGNPYETNSIPDVFDLLFRKESLYLLVVPIFLFVLSFILPMIINPLRLIRFRDRKELAFIILVSVFIVVIVFLTFYFISGFLYGWLKSGTLHNPWATEEGKPYIAFEGEVDLSLFSTGYMVLRYTITELFAFVFIGLLTTLLYLLINRFIIVFFIVLGFAILDGTFITIFQFTFFIEQAEIKLGTWGNVPYLLSLLFYFFGLIVVLCVAIYFTVMKKDFIPQVQEMD
jgi:hypothetical protein